MLANLQRECHPRKDGGVNSAPHVLVIDGTSDTEAVLKAVLEPRGTQVERTRGTSIRKRPEDLASPHVVVIDLDDASADDTASRFGESHRILLGSVQTTVDANDRFLAKPFQYPELLRTIEDLLALPHQLRQSNCHRFRDLQIPCLGLSVRLFRPV